MHELGIAQSIIDTAVRVAAQNGGENIATIRVQVGELRGIIKEQLTFCFSFAAKDTIAEGATLEIEVIPLAAHCESCNREFRVKNLEFICPYCKGASVRMVRGQELRLLEIELA